MLAKAGELLSPACKAGSGRIFIDVNICCNPICVPGLKPVIAPVRLQGLTAFYPPARSQPHPVCALRRNLFPGACPIYENRLRLQPGLGTGMFTSNGSGSIHQFYAWHDCVSDSG